MKKRSGTGMAVLGIVLAVALGLILISAVRLIRVYRLSKKVNVRVDGTISEVSSEEDANSDVRFSQSTPADVIVSTTDNQCREVAIVFVGVNESETVNEEVLKLIKKDRIPASFAIPAVHARENDGLVSRLRKANIEILSNGLDGKAGLEKTSSKKLLDAFSLSKEILDAESAGNVRRLCCPGTVYSTAVLKAAGTAGYQEMVAVEDQNQIDSRSFLTEADAQSYVSNITGKQILAIRLDGSVDNVHQEPAVTAALPAIDKQADLSDTTEGTEQDQLPDIGDITGWLLSALIKDSGIDLVSLGSMKTERPGEYASAALKEEDNQAIVYRYSLTDQPLVALCIPDPESLDAYEKVHRLLKKYRAAATFFVDASVPDALIRQIIADGYDVQINGHADVTGTGETASLKSMMTTDEDLTGADALLQYLLAEKEKLAALGQEASVCLAGKENLKAVRRACFSAGLCPVLPQTPPEFSAGSYYLCGTDDLSAIEKLLNRSQKADIKVCSIVKAIAANGTIPAMADGEAEALRKENGGRKSAYLRYVSTTEKALAFTFGNLSSEAATLDTAERLKKRNFKGTYFADFDELRTYGSTIEKLIATGEEIGVTYVPDSNYPADFDGCVNYLHDVQAYMKWRFDYSPKVVYLSKNNAGKPVREAIQAFGLTAVGSSIEVCQEGTQDLTPEYLQKAVVGLKSARFMRGGIVYFNIGYYNQDRRKRVGDSTVAGDMVDAMLTEHLDSIAFRSHRSGKIEKESAYGLKTISALMHSRLVYRLADQTQKEITMTRDVLTNLSNHREQFDYMQARYVGSNFVTTKEKLPGFSKNEIRKLDKDGRLTNDKVLFLSFDDWGTDESVNKILYVLDKYHVKATFFVLTQHVDANPNLLRAIAMDGHEVASHSDTHKPLADANTDHTEYFSLTKAESAAMRKDLVKSYQKLFKYIGDVRVDERKALSLDFRPPTLEISRAGMYEVYDVGFSHIISGDVSTNDYEKENFDQYLDEMKNGSPSDEDGFKVKNGSVIVMHMVENAKYTAQVLDEMIPIWKAEGYSFARVDQYTDQYTQRRETK
ncbi:polysaccharide deacetylase family protein [Porcincola sp. LCP21S3_C12]|uniref:polysaccharide deacetylase family protein n=1 Tax=Porcincola sp. LCP21S3_C12 TaxID=3438798 RepID=UPI003F94D79A